MLKARLSHPVLAMESGSIAGGSSEARYDDEHQIALMKRYSAELADELNKQLHNLLQDGSSAGQSGTNQITFDSLENGIRKAIQSILSYLEYLPKVTDDDRKHICSFLSPGSVFTNDKKENVYSSFIKVFPPDQIIESAITICTSPHQNSGGIVCSPPS